MKTNQQAVGRDVLGTPPANAIPQSRQFQNQPAFTERYVKMHGKPYYMRVYYDGTAEFVRYDETYKKWVFLIFPTAIKSLNC